MNADVQELIDANIPRRYKNAKLSEFDKVDVDAFKAWNQKDIFTLAGGVGTGKTHFAWAIFRCWHLKSIFYKSAGLILEIAGTYSRCGSDEVDMFLRRTYENPHLIVIDDLGAEKMSDSAFQAMCLIISRREEGDLPTIITTNLDLNQIKKSFDHRIASRIAGGHVHIMDGVDRRLKG